jgi:mRNA interferase MazF
MPCKQGDIPLVNYPYSDLSSTKRRPVIVVGNDAANFRDYIVAKITTNLYFDAFTFPIDDSQLSSAMPATCVVRCNELFSADNKLIIKKLSAMKTNELRRLVAHIQSVFDVI